MRAGPLRLRLVLEQEDDTAHRSSVGGRNENWVEVQKLRARAAYAGGREFKRAQQFTAELRTLFIIRFDSRLDTKAMHAMRLRSQDDGAIYRILYADDPDHRRREIHIHTTESQTA